MKRKMSIMTILLACLTIGACGKSEITGKVSSPDGKTLDGIEVVLYRPESGEALVPLGKAVTDKNGEFKIPAEKNGDEVLEINGNSGTGRILLKEKLQENIAIEYPVTEKIVFLHDNDLHFDFNELEPFKAEITAIRKINDDVFLFNAGDTVVRHRHRWQVNGELMTDASWYAERADYIIGIMNDIGYDLMTPGNHELAYIENYTREVLEKAEFPILAANIEIGTDKFPKIEPYKILRTKTLRTIAVIGLSRVSLPADTTGIKQLDPLETIEKYSHLANENDIVIALTHIGYKTDVKMAEQSPWLDIIIGGHSHTLLENAELINSVLVAQAGGCEHVVADNHNKYLGIIDVLLKNGEVDEKSGHVVTFSPQ